MPLLMTIFALFLVAPLHAEDSPELPDVSYSAEGDYTGRSSVRGYVFGRDHRTYVTSTALPWSMIGKVENEEGHCTGSLVGRDLVLTNAHCVLDDNGKLHKNIRFYPNMIRGKSVMSSSSTWVWWGTPKSQIDWALIRLNSPLGDRYGYFGIQTPGTSTLKSWSGLLSLAGYSGDYYSDTAGAHLGCSVTDWESGAGLRHLCDSFSGASGAPIFAKFGTRYDIVALNWGHDDESNFAAPMSAFSQNILDRREDDAGKNKSQITLQLCNRSGQDSLSVSVGYHDGEGWISRGWYTVANGTCRETFFPATADSKTVLLYANTARGSYWGGNDATMCVGSNAFTWRAGTSCNARSVGFRKYEIYRGKLNTYNFNP